MTQTNRQKSPSFSETESITWLAWLARSMQQHGQTIFLIEQLQPSWLWLSTRGQRRTYILTSRLVWGVGSGLSGGLIGTTILLRDLAWTGFSLFVMFLLVFLISGMIFGLIGGLIDCARFRRNDPQSVHYPSATLRQILLGSLLFGVIGGAIGGLIGSLFAGLSADLVGVSFVGMVGGLSYGPYWIVRSFARDSRNEIRAVETIRFCWACLPKGIVGGLIGGLIAGVIFWLAEFLYSMVSMGFDTETVSLLLSYAAYDTRSMVYGPAIGLVIGLMSCFRLGIRDLKTVPNQGIRLSLHAAALVGGVVGVILGLIVGLTNGLGSGLTVGLLSGLCIGLWYGGLDVIQHYLVRRLLWQDNAMPWDYAHFLDYAANELNFLQKVGGGYMFVHRYLLEYFATLEMPSEAIVADGNTISQPPLTPTENI